MLDSSQLQCRWALRSNYHVPLVSFTQLMTLAKLGLYNFRHTVFVVGLMAKHFTEYVLFIFLVVELRDWTDALSSWFCMALQLSAK